MPGWGDAMQFSGRELRHVMRNVRCGSPQRSRYFADDVDALESCVTFRGTGTMNGKSVTSARRGRTEFRPERRSGVDHRSGTGTPNRPAKVPHRRLAEHDARTVRPRAR